MDTKSVEHTNNLDNVSKQISNLLLKTRRLNVIVDNLQNMAKYDERSSKYFSSDMSTNDEYCECSFNVKENNESLGIGKIPCRKNGEASDEDNTDYKSDNECCSADANIHNLSSYVNGRTVRPLTHNAVQCYASTINPYKPLGENSDTQFFKKLGSYSDNVKVQNDSTNTIKTSICNSSEEIIVDENKIEEDNPLHTLNEEQGNESSSEIEICNIPKIKSMIRKNDSGYKSKTLKTQNDNRVSFHNSNDSFGEKTKKNVCCMDSIVPNIKPTEHIIHDERPMMKSATSYRSARRPTRRRHEEEIYDERIFDGEQPRTIREWYQYTKQIKEYASARIRSGAVKLAKSHNVILVLDISEHMAGYFQKLKSAALQYVYGIKQSSECSDLENGIGLAVFGRETRLIQEATSDYELIIELIGHLRPDGDAPVIAGLLMGYAGVTTCLLGCFEDIVLQAHMIVFTNGSSEQCKLAIENGENFIFDLSKSRVPSDINGVIDKITATTTKIFYVPIGGSQHNNTLEQAVRKTNGKIIHANEMHRLIRMTRVMLLAIQIASDIRYSENQSRDVIRRKILNHTSLDDKHEDCLDMVQDFTNPLKFDNRRGLYLELSGTTLTLGDRVRRGPDWTYDDQDSGLPGTVVGQDREGWIVVEWDNGLIYPYPHNEQMDILQIRKVNEPRVLVDELIAVGCRVVRGQDWKYGDHDGGIGTEGTILGEKQGGKVVVRWDRKHIGIYKMGQNGHFEVKLSDNYSNNDHKIGCKETDRYGHIGQRLRKSTIEKNAPYTMKPDECNPEDYVIPLYSETSVSAIWEQQKGSQWTKYPSEINVKIEKAYQRKKTGKIIIEMDRTTYIIHFSRMVQENAQNKTEMAVRRKD
ncbi:uncharacterized protein LOC127734446 [Mytilus californianus]|uniref:uncharacterized protein LOC127734446 n=1 Tax=Mytilus californianus TaxID=6549 RepID=UPI0022471580|nr:uncharacterized protein LOC127734446 [Mytilus californianus]